MSTSSTSSASSTDSTAFTDSTGLEHYYGLASGLDVDSIVKSMMTGDQNLIDVQEKKKQTLEWEQEAYQAITTSLRTFESTYLDLTSDSTMLSSNTYSEYTGVSGNSSLLSVSGTSSASPGTHTVDILQSATTAKITGNAISPPISGDVNSNGADLGGTSFYVTADGVKKEITFSSGETSASLNQKLADAFNNGDTSSCKVTASVDSNGYVTIQSGKDASGNPYQSLITVTSGTSSGGDALAKLGIDSGASNRVDIGSASSTAAPTLKTLFGSNITAGSDGSFTVTIDGTDVTLNTGDNLAQTFNKINSADAGVKISYNSLSDTVNVSSTIGGAAGGISLSDSVGFFDAVLGSGTDRTASGRDAIVSLDGNEVTRSSNTFTVSGISCTINQDVEPSSPQKGIQVTLTENTDDAVSKIGKFVDAYNSMITTINNEIQEKPDSSYYPLTDAQKASMTTDEITKWETQAKQGVIFSDPTVSGIMSNMRSMLDTSVVTSDGKTLTLNDIGITMGDSADSYKEDGQLHINETTLKAALQNDPSAISDLFCKVSSTPYDTDSTDRTKRYGEEGLCYKLQDVINDAVGTSGSMITLAGMPNESSAQNNSVYDQLKSVNDAITNYQTKYKDDQTRYYNEFTSLESYMSELNQQSSYLTSMLSSGSN